MTERAWYLRAYVYLAVLTGVGLVGIGIATQAAVGLGFAFGKEYVAGDMPGVTYTPSRCNDYFEYFPEAKSCESAAVNHHFDEIWRNGDVALLGGLVVVGTHLFLRRRWIHEERADSLPRRAFWVLGAAASGLGAAALLGVSLASVFLGVTGHVLQYIPAGIVAGLCCLAFIRPGLNSLRAIARETPS